MAGKLICNTSRNPAPAIARLAPLREELKAAVDADAESYNSVMKAYKQAKTAADEHSSEAMIDTALKGATTVPLCVAEKAHEIAQIVKSLEPITNPNMKSDLVTAGALASAALTGAMANVEINLALAKRSSLHCGRTPPDRSPFLNLVGSSARMVLPGSRRSTGMYFCSVREACK